MGREALLAGTMAKKQDQPVDKKRVYEIAARVFHDQGYDNTSMQDIASAIGITKAGLYHHIGSKEDLLNTVLDYSLDLTDVHVLEKLKDVDGAVNRLKKMIDLHLRMVLDQGNHLVAGLLHECHTLSDKDRVRINRRKKAYLDEVTALIEAVLRERGVEDLDPRLAAFGLLGMLNWTDQWYRPTGKFQADQIVSGFQKIFLNGLFLHSTKSPSAIARRRPL
jgi:AcrR family transcriptional regulator